MENHYHSFHIPVMGTGSSIDTPIQVAPLGISSVISLVDDILLEKVNKYYCEKYGLPFFKTLSNELDGRAKRITAYLETMREIVRIKMEAIKRQPFFEKNDKSKYFDLLPDESLLKKDYKKFLAFKAGSESEKDSLAKDLTQRMQPGSIDVNIMVTLDRSNYDDPDTPGSDEFTDAKAALRGYANSGLKSSIVFSAGINQRLFSYMTRFRDFYRDKLGEIKKKIVLKVSDFRSALIQGRFLAKKGLEIYEFRIESGLNCGGHAFPGNGHLLPRILQEFKDNREHLAAEFNPLIHKYYRNQGWKYPESASNSRPLLSVQGGIGNNGEVRRLREDFGADLTGWASPFLLVPEATCVDSSTRELLRQAGTTSLYVSGASPLGVPFNNVHGSGSENWTREMVRAGEPGSPCARGFLVSNTEFTKKPICLASREYQKMKLEEIDNMPLSSSEKENLRAQVMEKACICHHLGNGALIALGIIKEHHGAPQAICPGPNIAWFNRYYTLEEMVDHIYGRGESLVPPERPHMFANEMIIYVDYFEKQVAHCTYTPKEIKPLEEYKANLEEDMDFCLSIAQRQPYPGENLASIIIHTEQQRARLAAIYADFKKKAEAESSVTQAVACSEPK